MNKSIKTIELFVELAYESKEEILVSYCIDRSVPVIFKNIHDCVEQGFSCLRKMFNLSTHKTNWLDIDVILNIFENEVSNCVSNSNTNEKSVMEGLELIKSLVERNTIPNQVNLPRLINLLIILSKIDQVTISTE